jgi:hypothetical protein
MAPLRSLLVLLILAGLICAATAVAQAPVEWYTDTGGGGALARPAPHDQGGGSVAPPTPDSSDVNLPPPTEVGSGDTPPAQAAAAAKRASSGSARAARPQARPARAPAPDATAAEAEPAAAQAEPAAAPDDTVGSLPFTGLELAVIVAAGLCLLVAGAALRPRAARR